MMSEASRLVPPMSTVTRLGSPIILAKPAAPMTPPAGPDRIRFTGLSRADEAVIAPPPDRIIRNRPSKPPASSSAARSYR